MFVDSKTEQKHFVGRQAPGVARGGRREEEENNQVKPAVVVGSVSRPMERCAVGGLR